VDGAAIQRNRENRGFLRAVNGAAAAVRGRFILLLNNDAVPLPGALERAAARLAQDPLIGAVGGRIVDPTGRLQEAGPIVWRNANGIGFGAGRAPVHLQFRILRETDYCCGAFLLTPTEVFRGLGGFDERFAPAYYEEMDYCFRVRRAGLRCVYDPAISIVHYGRASAPSLFWPFRQMLRNRSTFRAKHGAELARRLAASPMNYWRAVRGRPLSRWVLLLPPARGEPHRRTVTLANELLDRGFFVTVGSPNEALHVSAGPFGSAGADAGGRVEVRGGPRSDECGVSDHFDVFVAMAPEAGATLCGALERRSPGLSPPLVICDANSRQDGESFAKLHADLTRLGVQRIETGDALAIVEASRGGAQRFNGATRS
jgi:GT2 family glycosyltransferase